MSVEGGVKVLITKMEGLRVCWSLIYIIFIDTLKMTPQCEGHHASSVKSDTANETKMFTYKNDLRDRQQQ